MPTKVFIGNVSSKTTEDDLIEVFGKYGKIVQHAIVRSFGFVHFENKEDAEKAIKELDDTEFKGSVIKVELSKTPHKNGNWVHRDFSRRNYGSESQDRYYKRDYDDRDRYYYYYDSYGYRERPAVPPPARSRPYDRPYDQTYSYRELPPSSYDRNRYYEDYYYKYGRSQYDKSASYYSDYYSYSSQPRSYPTGSSTSSGQSSYSSPSVTYSGVASNTTAETTTTSHSTSAYSSSNQ